MTITEIFAKAGMNTLLGMGTVFVMLVLISCIISLFKYIPQPGTEAKAKQGQAAPAEKPADQTESDVLIAVITAAIAAATAAESDADGDNGETGAYIQRSIQRRGK